MKEENELIAKKIIEDMNEFSKLQVKYEDNDLFDSLQDANLAISAIFESLHEHYTIIETEKLKEKNELIKELERRVLSMKEIAKDFYKYGFEEGNKNIFERNFNFEGEWKKYNEERSKIEKI